MFSIITMASSTTKPVEMVRAISVRLFRLYPSRYIAANVPTSDSGTATLGMTVAAGLRKKRKITITTSAMVSMSENCTSWTDARIVAVRSVRTDVWMDEGREVLSWGSRFVMRSTTWMMFAPGWRWTLRMIAGTSFIHAASLEFSTPSTTVATSESLTGAPFRYAITTDR